MTVEKLLEGCEHDGSYISVGEVKRLMKEYARLKCLEAIKNVRRLSQDICFNYYESENTVPDIVTQVAKDIQHIPNQELMPEL